MDDKREKHISKFMSLILRHKAVEMGIPIDSEGWCIVSLVRDAMSQSNVTLSEMKEVVDNSTKQRFSFRAYDQSIRANQGHSLEGVSIKFETRTPPDYLYHGTSFSKKDTIWKDGVKAMSRNLVHVCDTESLAFKVGSRHGKPFIFKVNAKQMVCDGISFYISTNKVWLVDYIDPKYLEEHYVY